MTTPIQIPLDLILPRRRARGRSDFIVSASNAEALSIIDGWRDWPGGRLALTGPEGAGKTHLAHVWMAEAGAEIVSATALVPGDVPVLMSAGAICVEDVDRLAGDRVAEAALFHLMNFAAAERASLLITGRGAPRDWHVETPDLASRLRGLTVVTVDKPDEALLRDLIAKLLGDRGLKFGAKVPGYLAVRIDRSAAAAADIVAALDRAALERKRSVSLSLVKEVLGH